ncbi:hypothetical protein BGZ63DRAFT_367596 [Mariannaea sp. PMI_226]|nr:hypothetical protein BGZ63DRAFT_367596 [Mariannaea sp. PMI_226]
MDSSYFSAPTINDSIASVDGKAIRPATLSKNIISSLHFRKTAVLLPPDASLETPPDLKTSNPYAISPVDHGIPGNTSASKESEQSALFEYAEDDSDITSCPWRHVDYLCHDWKEENIWSSWKYMTTRRREYPNRSRLENASWRTWTKCKYNLKTVSPETVNWLKDNDVTWLYGPLQQHLNQIDCTDAEVSDISSKTSLQVWVNNESILKRTPEIILQRPLSPSYLLNQSAPLIRSQETDRQGFKRRTPNRAAVSSHLSYNASSMLSSSVSNVSPRGIERKRIHFNDKVEQCIAVESNGDVDDGSNCDPYSESDSGDGFPMKRLRPQNRASPIRKETMNDKKSFVSDRKTIAILPSTTLNHEGPTQVPSEEMKHRSSIRNPILTRSLTQKMCSKHTSRFVEEEENYDKTDVDVDAASASSIFGRFFDIVNTARDMAYLTWNAGHK